MRIICTSLPSRSMPNRNWIRPPSRTVSRKYSPPAWHHQGDDHYRHRAGGAGDHARAATEGRRQRRDDRRAVEAHQRVEGATSEGHGRRYAAPNAVVSPARRFWRTEKGEGDMRIPVQRTQTGPGRHASRTPCHGASHQARRATTATERLFRREPVQSAGTRRLPAARASRPAPASTSRRRLPTLQRSAAWRPLAVERDAHERPADEPADERAALPLREQRCRCRT